jgi:hypothetical protein
VCKPKIVFTHHLSAARVIPIGCLLKNFRFSEKKADEAQNLLQENAKTRSRRNRAHGKKCLNAVNVNQQGKASAANNTRRPFQFIIFL